MKMTTLKPRRCPFCGGTPTVYPLNPEKDGDAWGAVGCANDNCPAKPYVEDGEDISDERGTEAYKQIAIKRWNKGGSNGNDGDT